jgi:5-epi-alpha-selinene synthase
MTLKLQAFYCPFPSAINQHCDAAYQHTLEWLHLFNFVTDESVYKTLETAKYYSTSRCYEVQ